MLLSKIAKMKLVYKIVSLLIIPSFALSNLAIAVPQTEIPAKIEESHARQIEAISNPDKVIIAREAGLVKSKFTSKTGVPDGIRKKGHLMIDHCTTQNS